MTLADRLDERPKLRHTDYDGLLCPMPVVWFRYEEDDEPTRHIIACDSELYVEKSDIGTLYTDVVGGEEYDPWKVICTAGHVLVLPNDEGNEYDKTVPDDLLLDAVRACALGLPRMEDVT